MLDTLSDMEVANKIMKTTNEKARDAESVNLLDKRFQQLGLDELTPLKKESTEYQGLKDYLINVRRLLEMYGSPLTCYRRLDIRMVLRIAFKISSVSNELAKETDGPSPSMPI